ncbi:MAG: hypothetical protein RQ899_10750 [Pseudomonadales bacterium]|nr:hypothetical protein [Pseudomonadales bacterium]
MSPEEKQAAGEATLALGFAEYQGQVLEFLDAKSKQEFASVSSWEEMQETVLRLLDNA